MSLGKRQVTWILLLHLALVWSAVVLRIDRFPLSWAPMYSVYEAPEREYAIVLKEKARLRARAWLATHRDGRQSWIGGDDLNAPRRSLWRLYYARTYQTPSPKVAHLNHDAGTFDRWLFGLEPGEPFVRVDWQRRLFASLNETLGHAPDDANFIVGLEAHSEELVFDRSDLAFLRRDSRDVQAVFDEAWRVDYR